MRPRASSVAHSGFSSLTCVGDAKHDGVLRQGGGGADEQAKIIDRQDGIDSRDQRRLASEAIGDEFEAGVGRRRRAHDKVKVEIARVAFEPLPAIVALLVDDDRHAAHPYGAKAFESVVDERAAADRVIALLER